MGDIARHKGSILGGYCGEIQPSQKLFESNLLQKLGSLKNEGKVLWVENESAKIGHLRLPRALWNKILVSPRVHVSVDFDDRVNFILEDYEYFLKDDSQIKDLLWKLERYAGREKCEKWVDFVDKNQFVDLVKD